MKAKPVPDGYRTITPYLTVKDATKFISFVQSAFDAQIDNLTRRPDGQVMHAAFRIGDSMVMVGDAPAGHAPGTMSLYLYVEDCDAWYARAIQSGATSIMEPTDMFYGDRHGGVNDAWGNTWWLATHIEDMSDDELQRRAAKFRA